MMSRDVVVPLLISVVLLAAAAATTAPLDRGLEEDGITLPVSVSTGVPADVLLLQQTLGAFRGWAIDALWLKALERRDQGHLHESMELAHWITKLQPYFPRVWSFQSSLLAFDMALSSRDPDQRWNWVRESIDLLRGPGLRANPRSKEIHRQLAYLFWYKLGEYQDDAALHYQVRLCQRWRIVLGAPPGADAGRYPELLRRIDAAPDNFSELPITAALDETRFDQLKGTISSAERNLAAGIRSSFPELAGDEIVAVEDFLRKKLIEGELNMSPARMARLGSSLGPIDWRTPSAHAVYWSAQGSLRSGPGGLDAEIDESTIDEVLVTNGVRLGLQQMVMHGRVLLDEEGRLVTLLPQPRLLPSYEKALVLLTRGVGIPENLLPRVLEIISTSVVTSWLQGEDDLARQLLDRHDTLANSPLRGSIDDLTAVVITLVLATLDSETDENGLRTLLEMIRAKALIAAGGGGTAIEGARGLSLARRIEEENYSDPQPQLYRRSIIRALRWPVASAPLSVKRKIWETLSQRQRESVDSGTRTYLRGQARSSGADEREVFPGIDASP